MTGQWQAEKEALLKAAREMARGGLVTGLSGNASLRLDRERIAITPSQVPYQLMTLEDIVVLDLEGEPVEGERMPSTESPTHLRIYRHRPHVQAILHTHPVFASVAAVAGLEIPPIIDELVVTVGGPIKVAEYGFPGSEELAQRALEGLEDRKAVLLRNHGLVAVGKSLEEALEISHLVERAAQVYIFATLLGRANPLAPEIVEIEKNLYHMRQN